MSQKVIEKIKSGGYSRVDLLQLRDNAEKRLKEKPGNDAAIEVIQKINTSYVPELQRQYVFVAFKPHSRIEDALDKQWYAGGFYDLKYYDDPNQMAHYYKILPGDMVITKTNSTREKVAGKGTMQLFAHGIVTEVVNSAKTNHRWFKVDWTVPDEFIEVPLMGCTKAIGVRDIELVEDRMPPEFWHWLKTGETVL